MTRRPLRRLSARAVGAAVAVAFPALALALAAGCGTQGDGSVSVTLPKGAFAVVGQRALSLEVLERALGGRDAVQASEDLIADARVALEAGARHPDRSAVIERGALVRGLIDALRAQTLEEEPPTAEELALAAQELWAELDRPRCVRTLNVMLQVPPLGDGERELRVMERVAAAVRDATTPEEFARRAQATDVEGLPILTVMVPPLTEDGRVYVQTPSDAGLPELPVEYAQAAARLSYVSHVSDVVATSVGYHVLMATDILPPQRLAEPERSVRLRRAVADRRIEGELERLRRDLGTAEPVWRSPHQAALTSLVWRTLSGP